MCCLCWSDWAMAETSLYFSVGVINFTYKHLDGMRIWAGAQHICHVSIPVSFPSISQCLGHFFCECHQLQVWIMTFKS